ncbi:hypothetical protein E5676_scaffold1159G00280 [Cucumis melo var. makuwa]|uniref:Uncharacterized protein n=1 Tax=Cucumis melo var. makuwa TaxID=1194695 RepID=A0A5A7SMV8_CUCMM|nr:hypothetical protein E6C27_scaffold219G002540 [Cucumis melo var. makuwa]TYJ96366.1 hypothetical protein E5676_scaffold1159G00280 [Cucumis melo var. makuwa]
MGAKRYLHFDLKAPRTRCSKKGLKSPSRGLQTSENDYYVKASEKERATLTIPEIEPPNDGDNLDGTHTTPSSPVSFDSLASRTRGALQKLAFRGQVSPIVEVSQEVGEDINEAKPNDTTPSSPVPTQLPKKA